jgi:hypothetical protein
MLIVCPTPEIAFFFFINLAAPLTNRAAKRGMIGTFTGWSG